VLFGVGGAVLGSGHHWLGLLNAAVGDSDGAIDHFEEARAVADRIDAPFWVAQAQMDLARVLACRGKAGDAANSARLIRSSMAVADRLGFGRILREASELA
jgi:hypothetical protein